MQSIPPTTADKQTQAQKSVSQDKELNRRIGLATMIFGKLKSMVFTSEKVSLRVKNNVYSAMVLSVLLHGAAESMQKNMVFLTETNCLG